MTCLIGGAPLRAADCVAAPEPIGQQSVSARPDHVALIEGTFVVPVLNNDVSSAGMRITAIPVPPALGTATIRSDGQAIDYTFGGGAVVPVGATDRFTYTVTTLNGTKSSTAQVDMTSITLAVDFTATCRLLTCDFAVSPIDLGGVLSYSWEYGDGTPAEIATTRRVVHTFPSAGTRNVKLRAFFGSGHVGVRQKAVATSTKPKATWDWDRSGGLSPRFWITSTDFSGGTNPDGTPKIIEYFFNALGNSNNAPRKVLPVNGTVVGQGVTLPFQSGQENGLETPVELVVIENNASATFRAEHHFERTISVVNNPPVAEFAAAAGVNAGEMTFDPAASTDEHTLNDFLWDFGDGVTKQTFREKVTHKYLKPGTYFVTLTVRDDHGSEAQKRIGVDVADRPPVAAFSAQCSGLKCALDSTPSTDDDGVVTTTWTFGDSAPPSTLTAPTRTYSGTGCFPVTLTVTDTAGQSSSVTMRVSVGNQPLATAANSVVADAHAALLQSASPRSNLNGIVEPGETVLLEPAWRNTTSVQQNVLGTITAFTSGHLPAAFTIRKNTASYVVAPAALTDCWSRGDCYEVAVAKPQTRPVLHWDADLTESNHLGTQTFKVHVGRSFNDIATSSPFYGSIEALLHHGVTTGCGNSNYCPSDPFTRAQAAVSILRAKFGTSYTPPACTTAPYDDVPCTHWAAPWIAAFKAQQMTSGCGNNRFCPEDPMTRGMMPFPLLRAVAGSSYVAPACTTASYSDVPCTHWAAPWVEEARRRGWTAGCTTTTYCPDEVVTREASAAWIATAFNLGISRATCSAGSVADAPAAALWTGEGDEVSAEQAEDAGADVSVQQVPQ